MNQEYNPPATRGALGEGGGRVGVPQERAPEKAQPEYGEIDLMDYIRVIIKRRLLILTIFLIAVIAAAAFSFLMPKVYKIDTSLEIGVTANQVIEAPPQVVEKIKGDVFGVLIREKLKIPEEKYPKIKTENPKDTNLIKMTVESANPVGVKNILEEINNLILADHQEKIKSNKEVLEKNIGLLENDINGIQRDIERVRTKIGFLEEEKKNLEAKVAALQKILPYQQDPGTQFALFDTKEKLEMKKQEIEDRYLEINSLESKINSLKNQINALKKQIDDIKPTEITKTPTISAEPIRPKLVLNVAISAILGIFIGVFLASGKEWLEKSKSRI